MSYKLEFEEHALKEFKKLGAPVREQFTKKLKEVLQNPHVPANRLHGMADCYKIKLRSAGYRLVYQVLEHEIVVLVLAVGKRERSEVYKAAKDRL
ncbi:type II toxin-antitoxin system RelE/ParE family toxin [Pectobacterium brasiliense]|mgnify:FL=1|uniref:Addiction module toxin RelE n=2 Tax=Pectobacterium TaxID=122277 RepID=A0ABD6VV12_9GAMM|nr:MULTISPECIES: type II toxin-antitoxin system RelE/ParE family toxin [Pectobacterium]KHT15683.1 RelE toxin [Pectobacterium carotovorum subsp. carotovorum]MBA0188673.1 type II toxin-antitoxin system RelE/ParE family toxin [Pectobacterium odoriferum]MBN3065161.1 type II toxin-antitoxin system RelE/ParE family toxin [Pectobacterium aquaticum]MBN3131839.1 type II toxin-antitoxin system RelE/ParE family toxin [Pectobacterium brasiliense]MBQ4775048.1 type II toxin-antitoxin system mRNA interferase